MSAVPGIDEGVDISARAGLQREFELVTQGLLELQAEVGALLQRSAHDPLFEHRLRHRLEELQRQRKDMMITWARIALSWKLGGGSVVLAGEGEPSAPAESVRYDAAPRPAPRGEPEVISRTRLRRPVMVADEGGATEAVAPPRVQLQFDHELLVELLRALGEPGRPIDTEAGVRDELERLVTGTSASRIDGWSRMPKAIQQALIGLVVARARHVQDEVEPDLVPTEMTGELDRVFSSMTSFSKREQPGFVFGLQRHHHPRGLTWLADARRWWADLADFLPDPGLLNPDRALAELRRLAARSDVDEETLLAQCGKVLDAGMDPEDPRLVTAMIPHYEALRKEARFKHLRKSIRDLRKFDEQSDAEIESGAELPEDWPLEGMVEGRIAIVVGQPSEAVRRHLQDCFRWARAEWISGDAGREMEDVVERARKGQIDQVVVLRRFAGLDADRLLLPVCALARVPVADVRAGYGVTAVRQALERALDRG